MLTEEGNKLIAEFMGKTFRAYKGNSSVMEDFKSYSDCLKAIKTNKWKGYAPEIGWKLGCGKYHESWDWLMPVWLKCKEIGLWMMTNGYDRLWLEKSKEIETAIVHEIDCNKAAFKIAQLIQWYNLNKN
jgi:hypothetical protein